ncbi:MAG TPA: ribosome maturation factor RimM [Anaerolineales bacterium]|nr:ribosome maturation factor RimM [Anaerolineales bacterium]
MSSRRQKAAARRKKNQKEQAGASDWTPPAFLLVGILRRPHGVRGEMIMSVMTDFPERLKPGITLYLGLDRTPLTIRSLRHHNRGQIIAFEGLNSREEVGNYRNHELFVRADDRPPLPEGEHYLHEILGLTVVTDQGETLGTVTDLIETGANGVFVVRPDSGKDILIPDIEDVILKIDLEGKQILVHVIEGLIE